MISTIALLPSLVCMLSVQAMRVSRRSRFEMPTKALPVDCTEALSDRKRYTFGPESMQLGDSKITAWGGKSDSDKGQDRELHICSAERCIFAIMDGHGYDGGYLAQRVKKLICAALPRMTDEASIGRELGEISGKVGIMRQARDSGSTLAGIVIQESSVVVFNAGDSPVVWTGSDLGSGILGGTEDHDCRNEAEIDRIRTFRNKSADWTPCVDQQGLRMHESGTMTTRGMGNTSAVEYGFLNEPALQTFPLPKQGEDGAHWFLLSSDGIVADQSEMFKMQLSYSRTEFVKMVALGVKEEQENKSDVGVRARLDEMMKIGNGFQYEELPAALQKSPQVKAEFPPGSGKQTWILKPEVLELLPALPATVGDDTHWRPKKLDGTKVTHGNGDDCSVLVVRVN